jgi:tRNA (cmo5U34)-methyltransferase
MREASQKEIPYATILDTDLRHDYPPLQASVTLSVLTLQFTPIEYRQKIIENVYNSTLPGGAFILVEKILGSDSFANDLFVDTYYDRKGENGYTQEQINAKRESLEGVLVPVTESWNRELLTSAGFKHVDAFWRHLNFAGWIGIKDV